MNDVKVELWKPKDEQRLKWLCNREFCSNDSNGSGLCEKHYQRWQVRRRFWRRVKFWFIIPIEPAKVEDHKKSPTELGIYD